MFQSASFERLPGCQIWQYLLVAVKKTFVSRGNLFIFGSSHLRLVIVPRIVSEMNLNII